MLSQEKKCEICYKSFVSKNKFCSKDCVKEYMQKHNPMFNKETSKKRRDTLKQKYPNWGDFNIGIKRLYLTERNKSIKNREAVSKALTGKPRSPEVKYKLKEAMNRFLIEHPERREMQSIMMKELYRSKKLLPQKSMLGKKQSEEAKKKISLAFKGKNHPLYGTHLSLNTINKTRETWKKNGTFKKFSDRMKNGGAFVALGGNKKVSSPENKIWEIIQQQELPFEPVGKGKFWLKGINHNFNPDFVNKDKKKIIEMFGSYWHNQRKDLDKERLETYSKYGYEYLVIWDYELKDIEKVKEKIKKFNEN